MTKMTKAVKEKREATVNKKVVNHMGGYSYEINPLDTLRIMASSSIFGEPQYYNKGQFAKNKDSVVKIDSLFKNYSIIPEEYVGETTSEAMEAAIDNSLSYNYRETLLLAVKLRKEFYMRLNPQVIMVRAAIHENRVSFNQENPGVFKDLNNQVMQRADDVITQFTYYLFISESKKSLPNILKRSWADRIGDMNAYQMNKYKNHGLGLIDVIRVCHAKGPLVSELVKTGAIAVKEDQKTWEILRSQKTPWASILRDIQLGHMALLRNLRGIFQEVENTEIVEKVVDELKDGVLKGKQFPFRYLSAYNAVESTEVHHKARLLDGIQECLDISCENMPKLSGKNAFLSDNSGSAWGTITSEYGTVRIAEIGNLSCIISAVNSEDGHVFSFGDKLIEHTVSKRDGILTQSEKMSKTARSKVGPSTENGIWLFLSKAINEEIVWDNIFIYSDMQAGHGDLYGTPDQAAKYKALGFGCGRYIDVAKLIDTYRKKVNPKVNVFCVQTAGYDNVLLPEYGYRTNILSGWTGKELIFADEMNKFWDEIDARKENKNS